MFALHSSAAGGSNPHVPFEDNNFTRSCLAMKQCHTHPAEILRKKIISNILKASKKAARLHVLTDTFPESRRPRF